MKFKRLFQSLVMFSLVFSSFGVSASTNSPSTVGDAIVINRSLSIWEGTYIGFVSSSVFEKWSLDLTEAHDFTVSVSTIAGDLVPLLTLQDSNGNEITHGTGSLTTSQPAGSYFIQTQPESGSGFYVLTLRQVVVVNVQPSVSTSVNPGSVNVNESATVTVSLNNVPAEGYTSAEFTCTYDPALLADSNIVVGNLFGADVAAAINDAHNGSFIVAIAGSNGNKATTSGPVFTFTVTGLQAGQASIECAARVSKGDNVLTSIPSTGTSLTVVGLPPSPTFTATPEVSPTVTSTPDGSATATSTPDGSATATSTPDGSATATSTPDGSATATSTPDGSATATFTVTPDVSPTPTFTSTPEASPTPLPVGAVNGQVNASKPVTISLYNADTSLAATMNANPDGTFNLEALPGDYTIIATASGFLSAQGSVTVTSGAASTMPTISLLAGDIDNNGVIDQYDAMTIGMSYNTADPASADLNNDGVINVLDLELLAQNYRQTGPTAWQ